MAQTYARGPGASSGSDWTRRRVGLVAKVGLLDTNPYTELRGCLDLEKRKSSTNPTIPTMATLMRTMGDAATPRAQGPTTSMFVTG